MENQKAKPFICNEDIMSIYELNDCTRAMKGIKEWMLVFYPEWFPEKEETKFIDIAKKVFILL